MIQNVSKKSRSLLYSHDAQTSLGEHLLELDLYERRDTSNDAHLQLTHPLLNLTQDLPRGKVFDVFITNVDQSGEFFVVKKANEHILVDIANQLQQLAEARQLKPLGNVQLGQICVARFPVELGGDGLYYRAEVLTVASGMVVVRYLDYGNPRHVEQDSGPSD